MTKKLKTYQKKILTILVLIFSLYFFAYKGNNRLTVWIQHGVWLPNSVEKIHFRTYPGLMAHLVGLDDWAKTELEIPKSDLKNILMGQEYQYVTSLDSAENKLSWTYNMSGYRQVPDSLFDNHFPLHLELKSARGDFLIFQAKELDDETVFVYLYTDWN